VLFSRDGRTVLTGSEDKTARLWEVPTGKPLTPSLTHEGPLSQLAFSPDGRILLTVSNQSTVRLWEAATGKAIGQPLAHPDPVTQVSFSPDSQWVRTITAGRSARIWDAATGAPLGLPVANLLAAQFPPDSANLLAQVDDRHGLSWELPPPVAGTAPRILCWAETLTGMELSPDGALGLLDYKRLIEQKGLPTAGESDRQGHALILIGDGPQEPGHICWSSFATGCNAPRPGNRKPTKSG
jgi:hypothetical protein